MPRCGRVRNVKAFCKRQKYSDIAYMAWYDGMYGKSMVRYSTCLDHRKDKQRKREVFQEILVSLLNLFVQQSSKIKLARGPFFLSLHILPSDKEQINEERNTGHEGMTTRKQESTSIGGNGSIQQL